MERLGSEAHELCLNPRSPRLVWAERRGSAGSAGSAAAPPRRFPPHGARARLARAALDGTPHTAGPFVRAAGGADARNPPHGRSSSESTSSVGGGTSGSPWRRRLICQALAEAGESASEATAGVGVRVARRLPVELALLRDQALGRARCLLRCLRPRPQQAGVGARARSRADAPAVRPHGRGARAPRRARACPVTERTVTSSAPERRSRRPGAR